LRDGYLAPSEASGEDQMSRKVLSWLARGLAAVLLLVAAFALYVQIDGMPKFRHTAPARHVEVTAERVERGKKLVSLTCVGCHLNQETGKLTGKHMTDLPPAFGAIYAANITRSKTHGIGGWSDGDLAYLLRTGVRPDGRYVPPYMIKLPHASDDDLDAILAFLRSDDPLVAASDVAPPGVTAPSFLVKVLSHTVMRPLPFPAQVIEAPAKTDPVAHGRYLAYSLDCFSCHSADFKSVNIVDPPKSAGFMAGGNRLRALDGSTIFSANITPDEETGIGRMTLADFTRTLKHGVRPDGYALQYPMLPAFMLDDDEVAAIYAYLRTVPKVRHAVERKPAPADTADPGKQVYDRYGCVACHGDTGVGIGDLRAANRNYPNDAELLRWILDAPSLKPGTRMPGWRGIVTESDYPALLRHVRKLSNDANNPAKTSLNP
jgi:mono/diheme cytochrome c family protein